MKIEIHEHSIIWQHINLTSSYNRMVFSCYSKVYRCTYWHQVIFHSVSEIATGKVRDDLARGLQSFIEKKV
jgi:hypothetical protein